VAGAARAQDAGIAGVVKDTSGAVLPGVTVTAASPVLIEQQHLAITDAEGRYTITRLRPGVYSITFSLPGFAPVVRQGVSLTAGFAANVDAELRVGSLTESITVTGASPAIDVVNVRKQTVVTRDQLEALPTSTKSVGTLATITTGLTGLGDVGGSYQVEPGQDVVSGGGKFHGKSGTKVSYDGMGMENSSGNSSYQLNCCDRGRNGHVDERYLGRHECRRSGREHHPEGREQYVSRRAHGAVLEPQSGEQQSDRRFESPRPDVGEQDDQALRRVGERRRADQARPRVVFCRAAKLGRRARSGGCLLEQNPGCLADAARCRAEGGALDAMVGSAGGSAQRPPRVVRLDSLTHHVAGHGEEQVQHHLRPIPTTG
jgi:hypothetical protein